MSAVFAISTAAARRPRRLQHGRRAMPRRRPHGSVTIEVLVIVPLMLLVLLGFTELYLYMRATSLVEHAAFTLADSIGQMDDIVDDEGTTSANSLGSLWAAAALLAQPEPLQSNGGVIVTSICDSTTNCGTTTRASSSPSMLPGTPAIYWQQAAPWTQGTMTSQIAAGSMLPPTWPFRNGDAAIVVEVFYRYDPFPLLAGLWPGAPGTTTIYRRVYARQRVTKGQAMQLVNPQ